VTIFSLRKTGDMTGDMTE